MARTTILGRSATIGLTSSHRRASSDARVACPGSLDRRRPAEDNQTAAGRPSLPDFISPFGPRKIEHATVVSDACVRLARGAAANQPGPLGQRLTRRRPTGPTLL